MRTSIIALAISILTISPTMASNDGCCGNKAINIEDFRIEKIVSHDDICRIGDYDLDVNNGLVFLYPRRGHFDKIKITGDYRLFVDGREYDLDSENKELVKQIHDLAMKIEEDASVIGREGARLGAAGAKIGIDAVAGVFRLIRSDYDSQDLEREMELKAEKLEARAARLEERATELEAKADDLERLGDKLEQQIPKLRLRERY